MCWTVARGRTVHMERTHRHLWASVAIIAALVAGIVAVGVDGWPGEPSGCIEAGDCYCEAFTGGLIEQPANTLSNLAFVAVGLWVIAQARSRRGGSGLIATDPGVANLYGWIAVGLGLGSMLFHGSMTEWGGWADLVSMYLFITFFLLYELRRLLGRTGTWMLGWWVVVNLALAAFQWVANNGIGKFIFGALIVATLAANRRVVRSPDVVRDERFFWAGLGTYVAGNVIWMLSRTGAPLCEPASLLQGHALWHITSAAAVGLFFLYLRSEQSEHDKSHRSAGVDHSLPTDGS